MGAKYEFVCPSCDYKAVVGGCPDFGFIAHVETMTCADCVELVDVLIGAVGEHWRRTGITLDDEEMGKCPNCKGTNLTAWSEGQACPKCGGAMRTGDLIVLWD